MGNRELGSMRRAYCAARYSPLPIPHLTWEKHEGAHQDHAEDGVLDPQGKAIQNALASLGFAGVNDVRQGKYIEVDLAEANEARAREQVERICKELLANTVIENYTYELVA